MTDLIQPMVARSDTTPFPIAIEWEHEFKPPQHEFEVLAMREDDGGYSIIALFYQGVVSQGDTLEEAKANIAEAFLAMLESSRAHGEPMPYTQTPCVPASGPVVRLRITVDG